MALKSKKKKKERERRKWTQTENQFCVFFSFSFFFPPSYILGQNGLEIVHAWLSYFIGQPWTLSYNTLPPKRHFDSIFKLG